MEPQEPKRHTTKRLFTILILILLSVVFLAYKFAQPIYAEMGSLKLIPTPEQFTELYFANANALPTSTTSGQTLSFSFTINNLEGTSTDYPYVVYFEIPDGGSLVLKRASVSLADNVSTTIPISYTFAPTQSPVAEQGEVVVDLPAMNNQQIDFFLPNAN